MFRLLLSVVASVVPVRYRSRMFPDWDLDVQRGAVVSALLQILGTVALLYLGYGRYVTSMVAATNAAVAARTGGDKFAIGVSEYSIGVLGFLDYLFQPPSLALFYFLVEGMIRLVAAVAAREVLPTLPLLLVALVHGRVERKAHEKALGPTVPDSVQEQPEPGIELRIECSRPKPWTTMTTISYRDQLYEIAREARGSKPRAFVYLLRRAPEHKVIRGGPCVYEPEAEAHTARE